MGSRAQDPHGPRCADTKAHRSVRVGPVGMDTYAVQVPRKEIGSFSPITEVDTAMLTVAVTLGLLPARTYNQERNVIIRYASRIFLTRGTAEYGSSGGYRTVHCGSRARTA